MGLRIFIVNDNILLVQFAKNISAVQLKKRGVRILFVKKCLFSPLNSEESEFWQLGNCLLDMTVRLKIKDLRSGLYG